MAVSTTLSQFEVVRKSNDVINFKKLFYDVWAFFDEIRMREMHVNNDDIVRFTSFFKDKTTFFLFFLN